MIRRTMKRRVTVSDAGVKKPLDRISVDIMSRNAVPKLVDNEDARIAERHIGKNKGYDGCSGGPNYV